MTPRRAAFMRRRTAITFGIAATTRSRVALTRQQVAGSSARASALVLVLVAVGVQIPAELVLPPIRKAIAVIVLAQVELEQEAASTTLVLTGGANFAVVRVGTELIDTREGITTAGSLATLKAVAAGDVVIEATGPVVAPAGGHALLAKLGAGAGVEWVSYTGVEIAAGVVGAISRGVHLGTGVFDSFADASNDEIDAR